MWRYEWAGGWGGLVRLIAKTSRQEGKKAIQVYDLYSRLRQPIVGWPCCMPLCGDEVSDRIINVFSSAIF